MLNCRVPNKFDQPTIIGYLWLFGWLIRLLGRYCFCPVGLGFIFKSLFYWLNWAWHYLNSNFYSIKFQSLFWHIYGSHVCWQQRKMSPRPPRVYGIPFIKYHDSHNILSIKSPQHAGIEAGLSSGSEPEPEVDSESSETSEHASADSRQRRLSRVRDEGEGTPAQWQKRQVRHYQENVPIQWFWCRL